VNERFVGTAAAFLSPLVVNSRCFSWLLVAPKQWCREGREHADAMWAAHLVLRTLSRLPNSPWRTTCLYRCVSECLVHRYYGEVAVVRLGVRAARPPVRGIVAHAWVGRALEHVEAESECADVGFAVLEALGP